MKNFQRALQEYESKMTDPFGYEAEGELSDEDILDDMADHDYKASIEDRD